MVVKTLPALSKEQPHSSFNFLKLENKETISRSNIIQNLNVVGAGGNFEFDPKNLFFPRVFQISSK